jgi:tRNA dimethylallyltransferase
MEVELNSNNRKIFSILGPTCTGKTKISLNCAKKLEAEIINVDSLLFYQELNIGTCKPTEEETRSIPHHLINIVSFKESFTAADYVKMALPIINNLLSQNKKIILVGGSGFYVQALLNGMYSGSTVSPEIIKKSNIIYEANGITPFIEELKIIDPQTLMQVHFNDHYRLRRALEYFWSEGKPFSAAKSHHQTNQSNIKKFQWNYQSCYLNLTPDEHYPFIQERTNHMLESGLIEEVETILRQINNHHDYRPLSSIGYAETIKYLEGQIKSISDLKEAINISTRQLAKAQRTWFKYKTQEKLFHPIKNENDIIEMCQNFFKE